MKTPRRLRLLALLAAGAIVSCNVNESSDPKASGPRTVEYTPKLMTLRGEPVPVVDLVHLRLWIGDTAGHAPREDRDIIWDSGSVKIAGLPVGERYTIVIEGVKVGMDGSTRSIWWTTSTSGFVPETATQVLTDNLLVATKDMVPPSVALPQSAQVIAAGSAQATLSFTVPEDASAVLVDGAVQTFSPGTVFSKEIPLASGQEKSVVVRIVDGNQNVWQDTVVFRRASGGNDTKKPDLALVSPSRDTTLSQGATSLSVRVKAEDSSGIRSVTVGGQPASTTGNSEWTAIVALAGTKTIQVVATDSAGNTDSASFTVTVPVQLGDVRLSTLGPSVGTESAPSGTDTIWLVTVPNSAAALDLRPVAADPNAQVVFDDQLLSGALRIPLTPAGDTLSRVFVVHSSVGGKTQSYLVRINHRAPEPIVFRPLGGKSQSFANSDSTPVLTWILTPSRALGAVTIDGQPAVCKSDTCSGKGARALRVGETPIVISASYADVPGLSWSDTVLATRAAAPASGDAGLISFGTGLAETMLNSDTARKISVPNLVDTVVIAPLLSDPEASFWIDGVAIPQRRIGLPIDGGTVECRVMVRPKVGGKTVTYRLEIEHESPEPVVFSFVGGKSRSVPFDTKEITFTWEIAATRPAVVTAGAGLARVVPDANGLYSFSVPVSAAKVVLPVTATYVGSERVWADSAVVLREADTTKPSVSFVALPAVVGISPPTLTIRCQASDNDAVDSVKINGVAASLVGTDYQATIPLTAGSFTVTAVAIDSQGNRAQASANLLVDTEAPTTAVPPQIVSPLVWRKGDTVRVAWQLKDNHKMGVVTIAGGGVSAFNGIYSRTVVMQPGINIVRLVASDSLGNVLRDSFEFETKLKDLDGVLYKIRKMPDSLVWMAENLRAIPTIGSDLGCQNLECNTYGRWYKWSQAVALPETYNSAAAGSTRLAAPLRGMCPLGWHIPTDNEWSTLFKMTAMANGFILAGQSLNDSVGALLLKSDAGWFLNSTPYNGRNLYDGFLLPAYVAGAQGYKESWTSFWLPTESALYANQAPTLELRKGGVKQTLAGKGDIAQHSSVRCVAN